MHATVSACRACVPRSLTSSDNFTDTLAMFGAGGDSFAISCSIFELERSGVSVEDRATRRLNSALVHDIWNMLTACSRMHWMDGKAATGEIDPGAWSSYMALDVETFMVQVASALDSLGGLIAATAPMSKSGMASTSLGAFHQRLRDGRGRHLPARVRAALLTTDFWQPVTQMRNEIVHGGGQIIMLDRPGTGFLFTLSPGLWHFVPLALRERENVVRLDRYASAVFAALMATCEIVGEALCEVRGASRAAGRARNFHPAHPLMQRWLQDTHEVLLARDSRIDLAARDA